MRKPLLVGALLLVACSQPCAVAAASDYDLCRNNSNAQPQVSIPACTRAISSGLDAPHLQIVFANRGLAYLHSAQWDAALRDLDRALQLGPPQAFMFALRGVVKTNKGLLVEAVRDLDSALALKQSRESKIENLYNRGIAYAKMSNLSAALSDYNAALKLDPSYVRARLNRGAIFAHTGEFDLAEQDFKASVQIARKQGHDGEGYIRFAEGKLNDLRKARKQLSEPQTVRPEPVAQTSTTHMPDAVPQAAAVLPPDKNTGDASSIWPNAYSRRNYKLGMTLSVFKQAPYPDQKEWPNAFPVCSNELPPKLAHDPETIDLQYHEWQDIGVVLCEFFYQSGALDKIEGAGLMLGDVSPMRNVFYFYRGQNDSEPRLFQIISEFPANRFDETALAFAQHLGRPQSSSSETVKNRLGGSFENTIIKYENDVSSLLLERFGPNLNRSVARYVATLLYGAVTSAEEQKKGRAADRL